MSSALERTSPSGHVGAARTRGVLVALDAPAAPPFDVVEAKLRVPAARAGDVSRTALTNRMRSERSLRILTAVAPAGYGKTTALAQFARRDGRAVAWVTVDERDNDPIVLLRHIAVALGRIEPPAATPALGALAAPDGSIWDSIMPRLATALASFQTPCVLVLDGVDHLAAGDSADAVTVLADHVRDDSLLVLSGRVAPRLPIARLRAAGRLLEFGVDDLALTNREAQLLLRGAGIDLAGDDLAPFLARSEGWAAGLYLAALATKHGDASTPGVAGDDRYVADYLRSEPLARVTPERRAFLRRASVLAAMSGPLCDFVLERMGSAHELEAAHAEGLFVVALDRRAGAYRYHPLLRDLLRKELLELEPEVAATLERRAADWFEAHGDRATALHHAHASRDVDRAARLFEEVALPLWNDGGAERVERYVDRFSAADVERLPVVAAHGALMQALRGRVGDAERWLAIAERRLLDNRRAWPYVLVVRALMCADGPERMLSDAESAAAELPDGSHWRTWAVVLSGVAHLLLGDVDRGRAVLTSGGEDADAGGTFEARMVALSVLALTADTADAEARATIEQHDLGGYPTAALALATSGRTLLRGGRGDGGRTLLASAHDAASCLTHAVPWLAVQTRVALAEAFLALRDARTARSVLDEAHQLLRLRPLLGALGERVATLQRELDALPEDGLRAGSGLTGAELRLLPLLATHLSFREIAEHFQVSRNTIKTQAIAVYRKFAVSSRSDAIGRAVQLGLLEAGAATAGEPVRALDRIG